jgi:molybdopterin-binding protein
MRARNAFKKTTTVEIEPGDVGSATMLEKVYMLC